MDEDYNENNEFNIQNRISEIVAELSDCREDERNAQNQILEIVSIVSGVLGLLFGASYLNPEKKNDNILIFQNISENDLSYIAQLKRIINENVTYARVLFWISLLVFCVAFAYIIMIGIDNVLRYYYIQNLEERLQDLIVKTPDNKDRGRFLHWNEYSAPIRTKNIKHITSTHTALSYGCYMTAIVCIILFSAGIVASLYLEIVPRKWFDYLVIIVVIIGMVSTIVFFICSTADAKKVAQYAWDTAHENQKIRMNLLDAPLYGKAKSLKRILKYLIYPKTQDLQKPILIVVGFIYGMVLKNNSIGLADIFKLIFIWFIFDFLAYQARYQINDIRGLDEDKEAGCQNRLISDDVDNPKRIIKISIIVLSIKILLALILTMTFGKNLKPLLLTSLGFLCISTILYEWARAKQSTPWIFAFVGIGYPLRFLLGFFSVIPMKTCNVQIIFFTLALWAYGSFSAILAWVNEVTNRMQKVKEETNNFPQTYKKKHFADIQTMIYERYNLAELHPINRKIIPMREKGNLKDPWNRMLFLSLVCLLIIAFLENINNILLIFEILVCILFIMNIFWKGRIKLIFIISSWFLIICKTIIGMLVYKMSSGYLLLSIMQVLVTVTYFVLCYQPQMKELDLKKVFYKIMRTLAVKVLGEYAVNIIENEQREQR